MACESAYKRRNCRKYGKGEDMMGIFHKGLRVCAILLVGVLWSASSQASLLNVFRGLSRLSDDSAKVGWALADSEFQKEVSIRISTHRAPQVWPKATPSEDYFSPGYEGYYDSADWSWKQENHKAGDDWQDETDRLFRELGKDTAKELGKEVVGCLGEHWRSRHPFDKDFAPNAIQNCDDKEVWSKPDLVRNGSFDKWIAVHRLASNFPSHTGRRDTDIANALARGQELYNLPNSLVTSQIKSLPSFHEDLLVSDLPSLNWSRNIGSRNLISESNGHKSVASFCSHHYQGLGNSLLDRLPSDGVIYRGWAADSTLGLEVLLVRRDQFACSSRHVWNLCEYCPEKDVGDDQVPLRLSELETVLAEAE